MGVTRANSRLLGTIPVDREKFITRMSGLVMMYAIYLRQQAEILSKQAAHFLFNFLRYFRTWTSVTGTNTKFGKVEYRLLN